MKTGVSFKDRMKAAANNLEAAIKMREERRQRALARLSLKLIEDAYSVGADGRRFLVS